MWRIKKKYIKALVIGVIFTLVILVDMPLNSNAILLLIIVIGISYLLINKSVNLRLIEERKHTYQKDLPYINDWLRDKEEYEEEMDVIQKILFYDNPFYASENVKKHLKNVIVDGVETGKFLDDFEGWDDIQKYRKTWKEIITFTPKSMSKDRLIKARDILKKYEDISRNEQGWLITKNYLRDFNWTWNDSIKYRLRGNEITPEEQAEIHRNFKRERKIEVIKKIGERNRKKQMKEFKDKIKFQTLKLRKLNMKFFLKNKKNNKESSKIRIPKQTIIIALVALIIWIYRILTDQDTED